MYKTLPHAMLVPAGFAFTITPLHYLYVKFLVSRSKKFSRLEWLHFLPVVVYKLYLIPDFFKPGDVLYETTALLGGDLESLPESINWEFHSQTQTPGCKKTPTDEITFMENLRKRQTPYFLDGLMKGNTIPVSLAKHRIASSTRAWWSRRVNDFQKAQTCFSTQNKNRFFPMG